jgi:hypothetical protein
MGTTALRRVQFGRESTWGTSVAAAAIMSGIENFSFKPNVTNFQVRTLDGTLSPSQQVVKTYEDGMAKISGYFTPEDFIYILDSGVRGSVTPTGAGPYIYTYNFPTTANGAPRFRTLEFYDGSQEWEMAGSIVKSFSLTGGDGNDSFVAFDSEWVGRSVVASTLTGALSNRAFNVLAANNTSVWSDDFGGTIGTTALTATLISWEFTCDTGLHLKKFKTGAVTPDSYGFGPMEVGLKFAVEYNATGHGEIAKYVAGTGRLIRLRTTGPNSTQLTIDFAGDITDISELWQDRDGNTTAELTLKARYDAGTFANYCQIVVQNGVATFVTNA